MGHGTGRMSEQSRVGSAWACHSVHVTSRDLPQDGNQDDASRAGGPLEGQAQSGRMPEEDLPTLANDGGLPPEPEPDQLEPLDDTDEEADAEAHVARALADAESQDELVVRAERERHANAVTRHRMTAHDRLAYQSRVVLRLGQMLLACGASSFRVKDSMATLARAVGIEQHHAQVTYTEIVATAYANGTFRTELAEQRQMGVNADKIDRLSNYVDSLAGTSATVEDVDEELDRIDRVPALYGWLLNALASGLACAAFAFLNHGGVVECSVVALAAFVGQALRRWMMGHKMNHFGVWMACGAVAATIYVLLVTAVSALWGIAPTHQAGFISAILFLIPGFPLVTGIIDLIRQDFQAGITRLTYVAMLMISAGMSVWMVSLVFNWSATPAYDYSLNIVVLYALRILTSFVASFGFAMLFNSPPRVCAAAALIAMVINPLRLVLAEGLAVPAPAAVGLAALAAGLLATVVARKTRYSRVTLSVPAVVIMIPGVPLYRSLAYLNQGLLSESVTSLFTVLFTIVAIGVGLAISRMVTDRNWLVEQPHVVPSLKGSFDNPV